MLAIVFIFIFRNQIATLILGIRRFGREGLEVSPPSEQQARAPAANPANLAIGPEEEMMRIADPVVLRELEQRIRADIQARGLEGSPNLTGILVHHLAYSQLLLVFEAAYSQIWGSQIAILQYLNPLPTGAPIANVRPFYDAAAQQYPQLFAAYPFENYVRFLESFGLVRREGDQISITPLGREFLAYIARTGKSIAKPQ